ncbi:hypothetical protein L7F22_043070 [Adiantum nelumboides]|nr:hypothetical protein [Adiantum nelumboides]
MQTTRLMQLENEVQECKRSFVEMNALSKVKNDYALKEEKIDTMRCDVSEMKDAYNLWSHVYNGNLVYSTPIMQAVAHTKNVEYVDTQEMREQERRSKNIVIRGIVEKKLETSSFLAFCFMLGSSCISWLSKKQPTVATSNCEAKYRAIFTATVECVCLRHLMVDLGVGQNTANTIYTGSHSTLAIARNLVFHACTKHIEVRYHYVRERLLAREINLAYVPIEDNFADSFTKALSREKFEAFCKSLGLLPFVD